MEGRRHSAMVSDNYVFGGRSTKCGTQTYDVTPACAIAAKIKWDGTVRADSVEPKVNYERTGIDVRL
jgi:hypothetical protein